MRACELAALAVQDQTFLKGPYVDPIYQARRAAALVIAVNCTQAAATCFCTSMGTGPQCSGGFDIALTEIEEGFLLETATDTGAELATALATVAATDAQLERADACAAAPSIRSRGSSTPRAFVTC